MKKLFYWLFVFVMVGSASARIERYWEPDTADVDWNNPSNWSGDRVPQMNGEDAVERAYIYGNVNGGPEMNEDVTYPPVDAVKLGYSAPNQIEATWTINAGTFGDGTSPDYVSIGDGGGYGTSSLFVNGGHMIIRDHFEIGRKSTGYLLMTDGLIECGSWRIGDSGEGADGTVDLMGGVISATELLIRTGVVAQLNIGGTGRVEIQGDHTASVNGMIDNDQIQSQATLVVNYVGGVTSIAASYDPAIAPIPADGALDIPFDVALSWSVGLDPNNLEQGNPSITGYKVYLGTDSNASNLPLVATLPVGTPTHTPGNLLYNQTYYWRVDGIAGSHDIASNSVWTFNTEVSLPGIVSQPSDIDIAFVGDDASFTVEASRGPFDYQWYYYPADANEPDNILIEVGNSKYSGAISETLTVLDLTFDDEKMVYLCEVTNSEGTVTTDGALLGQVVYGLLGHWPMEGNADDISGAGNAGISDGTISYVPGIAELGQALSTGGEAGLKIENQEHFVRTYNAMTVSCWMKCLARTSSWNAFIVKYGENDEGWQLRRYSDTFKACFTLRGTSGEDDMFGSKDVMDYEWHHVVGTYDGTTRSLYVDGLLDVSQPDTGIVTATIASVGLSRRFNPSGQAEGDRGLEGHLDDARIYDYALNATEVALLYTEVKELCVENPFGDFDGDCVVSLQDFAIFAASWLDCGFFPVCIDTID